VAVLLNGKVLVTSGNGPTTELYSPGDANDLGSVIGNNVVQGNGCSATNVSTPSCSSSNAPDVSFTWTAPSAGTFTFTTAGSNYDTILQVQDATTSNPLGCNDDANSSTFQSSLTLTLAVGQRIKLIIDGYSTRCGDYALNIQN
jgi:hypothetical protein